MIATPRRQGFSVVASFSKIVRLGEGLSANGRLSAAAMDRAVDALKNCAEIIARWDVVALRCVTTEACRSAANGPAFVARVQRETGLRLEVIEPHEEARLAVRGCSGLIDPSAQRVMVFDIGGGSTELSFLKVRRTQSGDPAVHLADVLSLPFGVVRLSDGLAPGGFAGAHYEGIRRRVAEAIESNGGVYNLCEGGNHLIGTSGTATSLAAMKKGLRRYRRREVDGSWLSAGDIQDLASRLGEIGLEGRRALPCIGDGRADLIMPGCAILQGILDATGCTRIRVADRGLREGLIIQMLTNHRRKRRRNAVGLNVAAQPAE